MKYSEKVRAFLTLHGMEPERVEPIGAAADFLGEMQLGLHGRPSSIRMIPTYLTSDGHVAPGRRAAVIDAGGTNFRTALVSFDGGSPRIERLSVCAMPGSDAPVSWQEFIDFAAGRIAPLLSDADCIGFCFSYPTEETPERDGYVLSLTKQVRIDGFEGRLLCADLRTALAALGAPDVPCVLLNDTPAVLLSGACTDDAASYDGLVGLISGTGTNTCCSLPVERIKKTHGAFIGSMLINLESGAFSLLPRGDYDVAMDAATVDAGEYRHEKMTSGAYVGELCRLTLRGAADEGLFSPDGTAAALALERFSSAEADACACGETPLCADPADCALTAELCCAIFHRAARCVCANLTAILILTDRGGDPNRPALVCADGSMFCKSRVFRTALEGYMEEFAAGRLGRHCAFRTADNATMLGTAAAALLNT